MDDHYSSLRDKKILMIFALISIIFAICLISGCLNETKQGQTQSQNLTGYSKTDVIVPVDLPSDLIASNVMTKKNGVPGGGLIYEGLITKNRQGTYVPVLAESWNVSDDAKTWTFHLVRNATWHDGKPVTSADVRFTNDYLKANNLTMGFVLSDVASVECPDDSTVIFHLKRAYSVWPDRLAQSPGIGVYPRHIYEQISDPKTWKDPKFIGTGPFTFDKSEPGYVRLARNDAYRGDKAEVTGVILKLITNKDSQVLALKNGEIDVVYGMNPAIATDLGKDPKIGIISVPSTTGYEMGFNMIQYPSNISAFRHAMSHAINRDMVCNILGNAHATNTTFLFPEFAGDYINPADTGMYGYNISQTAELLTEAGFVKDGQGILHGPGGEPVILTMPLGGKGSTGGVDEKIATVLRNDWLTLGIDLKTVKYDDEGQYRKAIDKGHLFIDAMPAILHDDPDDLVDFAVTPLQEKNYYNFNNSEFNAFTGDIRNTTNRDTRRQIGYRMQDMLAKFVPTVPICTTDTAVAYRKDRFFGWEKLLDYANIQDPRVILSLKPGSSS
jgi:peptide/nickel transport system substrate-binding protein